MLLTGLSCINWDGGEVAASMTLQIHKKKKKNAQSEKMEKYPKENTNWKSKKYFKHEKYNN